MIFLEVLYEVLRKSLFVCSFNDPHFWPEGIGWHDVYWDTDGIQHSGYMCSAAEVKQNAETEMTFLWMLWFSDNSACLVWLHLFLSSCLSLSLYHFLHVLPWLLHISPEYEFWKYYSGSKLESWNPFASETKFNAVKVDAHYFDANWIREVGL